MSRIRMRDTDWTFSFIHESATGICRKTGAETYLPLWRARGSGRIWRILGKVRQKQIRGARHD